MRSLVDLLAAEFKMKTETCETLACHMKPVLDVVSKFHKLAFQKEREEAKDMTEVVKQADNITGRVDITEFPKEEREWRASLDTNTEVDAFKRDAKHGSEQWSKAKIKIAFGSKSDLTKRRFKIGFHHDVSINEAQCMIGADSTFIAPCGTMSISQNWRYELKVGD